MIELDGISREFGGVRALGPVSLEVAAGTTTVLLGPSGCGKSTALRLMLGLVSPTAGRVVFDGREVAGDTRSWVRRRAGYVVQDGGLFPHMTVKRNLSVQMLDHGASAGDVDARIEELLALTHLDVGLLGRYPGELSGGQRQRVALMRALMPDPAALLMDEPLGALDPITRRGLQGELREIFRRLGKTVVIVTHDLGEARHFAESDGGRIVLLRQGQIEQAGSFEDLAERPASDFVREFVSAETAA